MKGSLHPQNNATINPSRNESILNVIARAGIGRRRFLVTAASTALLTVIGEKFLHQGATTAPIPPSSSFAGIGFESIPPNTAVLDAADKIVTSVADRVNVPAGYNVEVLASWGDPITQGAPSWAPNVSQDAAAQEQQFGMHNDGMHFFPLSQDQGLLCVNHEYTHEAILHPDGLDEQSGGLPGSVATIAKIRKSQAAHGVSVVEIRRHANKWQVVKNSQYNRRITANTPMKISGPAAGHPLMRSKEYSITPTGSSPTGKLTGGQTAYGTANNCAHGYTPWGTYLTCEENWNGYFGWKNAGHARTKLESRYGVSQNGFTTDIGRSSTSVYKWHLVDDRWDTDINPNEPNHFGWCVEIDPLDPNSVPVKRTTMGRFKHESATFAVDRSNRIAFYMGDDERNEYIYKFVCANPINSNKRDANRDLLDQGTLYVAKFTSNQGQSPDNFRGEWIPLTPNTIALNGQPLRANPEFAGANDTEVQALLLIKTRMAADAVGATMMDRPEWTAVRPQVNGCNQLEVYCTLTNNNHRGNTPPSANNPDGSTGAGSARPPVDVANPRPDNGYGHIIRWREDGNTPTARGFDWEIFVLCGDNQVASHVPSPKNLPGTYTLSDISGVGYVGNVQDSPNGSANFGAPDGLWFDKAGRLWIQTDQQGDGAGNWQKIGSNVMMCADPNTREIRRFLTSPSQCEVTGMITTPDGRTMFVGIQHPGEESLTADPDQFSNWPASQFGGPGGRPRSSVLVITRQDNGVIGGL